MAEQPAMESATETQNESVAPMPKPLNVSEAATNLKNLLDPQASETQEVASEESSKEVSDSETNIEETYDDPELIDQIEDETPSDTNQELYALTVNGENVEVSLDELKKGYSRQSDYTRKTEKLSQDRKSVEVKNAEATRLNEEAKIKRDQYEQQLQILSEHLQSTSNNVDMERLYQEDPAQYVKLKAEYDRRKQLQLEAQQEQNRIKAEKQKEAEENYSKFVSNQQKILAEKLPIYADEKKGPEFKKDMVEFARSKGYTDEEISMLVDHRAILLLADAFRYNQIKKNANLKNKKVTKVSKVVSSSSPKIQDDSEEAVRLKSQKANLKRTGKVQDAANVLQQIYSQ